jgi:hypothetical protein
MKDGRKLLATGQPNPNFEKNVVRRQLKFDRNAPLVVVGGPHDGDVMTATFSTNPRPRGKKDDPKTQWISDLAYLLRTGLKDATPVQSAADIEAAINKHAGRTVRIDHGLTAQCRPDKVRYIAVLIANPSYNPALGVSDANPQSVPTTILDPSGGMGCGERYYTKDFKNPQTGGYDTEIACDCGTPTAEQAAQGAVPVTVVLRAFEQVERILPPLGQ